MQSKRAIGVSKRCCPVCAYLLSLLLFVFTGAHHTIWSCGLPEWIPPQIIASMISKFGGQLKDELINLKQHTEVQYYCYLLITPLDQAGFPWVTLFSPSFQSYQRNDFSGRFQWSGLWILTHVYYEVLAGSQVVTFCVPSCHCICCCLSVPLCSIHTWSARVAIFNNNAMIVWLHCMRHQQTTVHCTFQ